MAKEISYEFQCLTDAIEKVNSLKSNIPTKYGKSSEYEWDYLYTGLSKGNVLDSLVKFYSLTTERSYQIEALLNNILSMLNNAKTEMERKDNGLAKEYSK